MLSNNKRKELSARDDSLLIPIEQAHRNNYASKQFVKFI